MRELTGRRSLAVVVAVLVSLLAGSGGNRPLAPEPAQARLAKLPVSFVANRGQHDPRVAFVAQGAETTVYFTSRGATYALADQDGRYVVKLDFVGARAVRPQGRERLPGIVSYFRGSRGVTAASFARVTYRNLWPGIDLIWTGKNGRLAYDFVLHPGADPDRIRLRYRGTSPPRPDGDGGLVLETPVRELREGRPVARQGGRQVEARYALDGAEFGFHLGSYDRTKPLRLDPPSFLYAGFIGGSSSDVGRAIALDSAGNAYVAGYTFSTQSSFPASTGPDVTHNGASDAFVAKINPAGTALVYTGYIGGVTGDYGYGIAVDAAGSAYVTGWTSSTEATFPVTGGPDLAYNGGPFDAFVAKVNPAGTALLYSGYLGGSGDDFGTAIGLDSAGSAYVTGWTTSTQATFPVTVGPDLTQNGDTDAFVAKVNPAGTALSYAGYIGGSSSDVGNGIAVDAAGNAYVTGSADSTEGTFPVVGGPDLTYNGNGDAYVTKVNPAGTALTYAGFIGGSGADAAYGIAVDSSGRSYVAGATTSTEVSFPVAIGPDLTHNGGTWDGFVAAVAPTGTALDYAGYVGGAADDYALAVAADPASNAYVTGLTDSDEASFPVAVGPELTYDGSLDAIVAKINAPGTTLLYAGYVGGSAQDIGYGIAVDAEARAHVTGDTGSAQSTFPVTTGPDLSANGSGDAFAVQIPVVPEVSPPSPPPGAPPGPPPTPQPPTPPVPPQPPNPVPPAPKPTPPPREPPAPALSIPAQPRTRTGKSALAGLPARRESSPRRDGFGSGYVPMAGLATRPGRNPYVSGAPVTVVVEFRNGRGQVFRIFVSSASRAAIDRFLATASISIEAFPLTKEVPSPIDPVHVDRLLVAGAAQATGRTEAQLAGLRDRLPPGRRTLAEVLKRLGVSVEKVIERVRLAVRDELNEKVKEGELEPDEVAELNIRPLLRKVTQQRGAPFLAPPAAAPKKAADFGRQLTEHPQDVAIAVQPKSGLPSGEDVVYGAMHAKIKPRQRHFYVQNALVSTASIHAWVEDGSVTLWRSGAAANYHYVGAGTATTGNDSPVLMHKSLRRSPYSAAVLGPTRLEDGEYSIYGAQVWVCKRNGSCGGG